MHSYTFHACLLQGCGFVICFAYFLNFALNVVSAQSQYVRVFPCMHSDFHTQCMYSGFLKRCMHIGFFQNSHFFCIRFYISHCMRFYVLSLFQAPKRFHSDLSVFQNGHSKPDTHIQFSNFSIWFFQRTSNRTSRRR